MKFTEKLQNLKNLAEAAVKKTLRRLGLFRRDYFRVGSCLKCGECCKSVIIFYNGEIVSSKEQWDALTAEEEIYSIFRVTGETPEKNWIFGCSRQRDDGTCAIHKSRPGICRDYPDLHLMRRGAQLKKGCGYMLVPPKEFEEYFRKALR